MQGRETTGPGASPLSDGEDDRRHEVAALVLDAAAKLFALKGVRRTTVRDIAAAAGVSHPLVHAYLGTKEAILADVFARHGARAREHAVSPDAAVPELAAILARYALGEGRDYARLSARAALEGVPFPMAADAFRSTRALADHAVERAGQTAGSAWYPGIGPRVLIASLVAMCIGWAAVSERLLEAVDLEHRERDASDAQLVSLLVDVFEASLPATEAMPAFPGAHRLAPPPEMGTTVPAVPRSGVRRGGRAYATEQILLAAERLYGADHQEPTIREVAEAAGVSHALVHRYVGSKQDLETLVLERNEQRMIAATRHSGCVQQAALWSLREDLRRGRPYLRLGARAMLDGGPTAQAGGFAASRHMVTLARAQTEAAAAPAPFPGADPALVVCACMAMATGWVVLDTWLPRIVGLGVPQAAAFDENFLAVVDCALTAHIPA
jgi:AcrR family transcriptional regulator